MSEFEKGFSPLERGEETRENSKRKAIHKL